MLTRSRPTLGIVSAGQRAPRGSKPPRMRYVEAPLVTHEDIATYTALILLAKPSLAVDVPAVAFMAVVRATLEATAELARQDQA